MTISSVQFWIVEVFGGGAIALILNGWFGLGFILVLFVAVLIAGICTAPMKQRNELRREYRKIEGSSSDFVPRLEYETQKRKLSHIQKYSPKILDEEQEKKLIQQIKTLRLSEVTIRLDASTSSGDSTPLVVQLCHIVEEAGCTLKDERLYRETSSSGGHDDDVWLEAGEEVKADLKSMLEDAGLSVETREQPKIEGRWAKIIVAVKIGK